MKNKKTDWNKYFMSHYRPEKKLWSRRDVDKYRQWYYSWFEYIEPRCEALQSKAKIFEIGSGIGATATLLRDKGHTVIGSDISDLMVKIAGKLNSPMRFILCDIQKKIPILTKFDVIMGFEVLEHLPKLNLAMKHIFQSLAKGGYFVGTSPYPYKKNYQDPTHVNVKYPDQWVELFRQIGYTEVKTYQISFVPYLWRIHKRLNIVLPFKVGLPYFVSTTLIVAKK